jgi:signal peptidase II
MMPAIYNVADSFICISMVVFVLLVILGVNLDGTRTVSAKRQAQLDAAEPVDAAQQLDAAQPLDGGAAFSSAEAGLDEPTRASRPDERDRRDTLGHDAT